MLDTLLVLLLSLIFYLLIGKIHDHYDRLDAEIEEKRRHIERPVTENKTGATDKERRRLRSKYGN